MNAITNEMLQKYDELSRLPFSMDVLTQQRNLVGGDLNAFARTPERRAWRMEKMIKQIQEGTFRISDSLSVIAPALAHERANSPVHKLLLDNRQVCESFCRIHMVKEGTLKYEQRFEKSWSKLITPHENRYDELKAEVLSILQTALEAIKHEMN